MPIPAVVAAAAASGGASLGSSIINSISTAQQNKKSRQWSEKMYNQQYGDNIDFWQMQNEYNSPENQMSRFRDAGLNPALIYGQGSSGQAGSIQTPDVQQAQFRSPEWGNAMEGVGSFMSSIYDYEIKQAQIDNLKADNTVKLSQASLLASQNKRSDFDLGLESKLEEVSAEARREQLRKLKADTRYTLDDNERKTAMNSQNIKESLERILNYRLSRAQTKEEIEKIKSQKKNLDSNTALNVLEKELNEIGLTRSDPMYMKMLGRFLNSETKESGSGLQDWLKSLFK